MHPALAHKQQQASVANPGGVQYRSEQVPEEEHRRAPVAEGEVGFGEAAGAKHRQADPPEQEMCLALDEPALQDGDGEDQHDG